MGGALQKLKDQFRRFPGIGMRQAERFVYYLLSRSESERKEIADLITRLGKGIVACDRCGRYIESSQRKACEVCADESRDASILLVVEKDIDFEKIRRSGAYRGHYFMLGGTVPILEKNPESRIRLRELMKRLAEDTGVSELILALSATPQGDHTAEVIRARIDEAALPRTLTVSMLGRGLSTGTEIEYSDDETIQQALKHRE